MHIKPVDQEPNLYSVIDVMPAALVSKILATSWLDLPWQQPPGQSTHSRRQILDSALPWALEWDLACHAVCAEISAAVNHDMGDYVNTVWWLDEPGYHEPIHSNNHGANCMHLYWIGARVDLGSVFFWYFDAGSRRYQFAHAANSAYVTVSRPNQDGTQNFLWNGMLEPVPRNTFRLSSQVCFGTP